MLDDPQNKYRAEVGAYIAGIGGKKKTAPSTSFFELTERYPDEASAIVYFEQKRWPKGVACVSCKSKDVNRGKQAKRKRQLWRCQTGDGG